jgi:hypothetical protein
MKITNPVIIGQRFGSLVALSCLGESVQPTHRRWLFLCDCGKTTTTAAGNVKSGHTTKCRSCARKLGKKIQDASGHQFTYHPLYSTWRNMMNRCYKTNVPEYKYYGARGIIVCEAWHDFLNFAVDMRDKADPALTLERINNDGNYEPSNCCWATRKKQANNRRTHALIHKSNVVFQ